LARARLPYALTGGLIALLVLAAAPAHAASVEVAVGNVRSALGHVLVAICTKDVFLTAACQVRRSVPSVQGTTVVRFEDVPPGDYAAQAFLDEYDWGEVRRDMLGFPENGIGFSNDAPMRFGPPKWDDAHFAVGATPVRVSLNLKYYAL
jgi:uncharacterized protein (DUF2141 family)